MAGSANPNMVQPIATPMQRASSANMQAFNTYSNPAAAAANVMNPYQQQVVDATIRDVGNAAQIGLNRIGAQAQGAGAYGGSRQGIAEAEALKGFNQQALDQVSRLNQQGYQQSINNAFNAASGLQNVGNQAFNFGNQLQQNQMQQGAMQQQMMQNLINAGKQQFAGFTGQPQQNLNTLLSTISAQPQLSGQERSFKPGLFNYLQFAAGLA